MFLFIIIVIIIIILIIYSKAKNSNKRKTAREEFDKLKNAYIIDKKITVTKELNFSNKEMINFLLIDEKSENIIYLQSRYTNVTLGVKFFAFKNLLRCEVFRNDTVYLIEEQSLIGDRVNEEEKVELMGLRLTFDDMSFPMLEIPFITSEVSTTSPEINKVHRWASIFKIIINRGQTH